MSASLVGSEMCIRDSTCASALDGEPHCDESSRGRYGETGLAAGWLGAVSYTHLTLPTICSV
eukprot:6695319-Alexandrium_andersonii.AAC.1